MWAARRAIADFSHFLFRAFAIEPTVCARAPSLLRSNRSRYNGNLAANPVKTAGYPRRRNCRLLPAAKLPVISRTNMLGMPVIGRTPGTSPLAARVLTRPTAIGVLDGRSVYGRKVDPPASSWVSDARCVLRLKFVRISRKMFYTALGPTAVKSSSEKARAGAQ